MEIDGDTLDLLERRLAERVEKRVRGRLFSLYGLIGSGVRGALGFFGYDLIRDVRETLLTTARDTAQGAVAPAVEDAGVAATAALAAAESAKAEANEAQLRLSILNELQSDTQVRVNRTLDEVNDLAGSIDLTLAELRAKLAEADQRIDRLREKSEATFLGGEYAELVEQLADEVARLDEQLRLLGDPAESVPSGSDEDGGPASQTGVDGIEPVVVTDQTAQVSAAQIQQNVMSLSNPTQYPVFIQYFGSAKAPELSALVRGLREANFTVPPEESLDTARGLAEVRYFFEADAEIANEAAEAINGALERVGLIGGVEPRNMEFMRAKPQRGVLELWLDITELRP